MAASAATTKHTKASVPESVRMRCTPIQRVISGWNSGGGASAFQVAIVRLMRMFTPIDVAATPIEPRMPMIVKIVAVEDRSATIRIRTPVSMENSTNGGLIRSTSGSNFALKRTTVFGGKVI